MKEEIISHSNDPRYLENLYRDNKAGFKKAFDQLYPEIKDNPFAEFWNQRLNFERKISGSSNEEIIFIVIASFLAGLIAKIPDIFPLEKEFFYMRNIGFVIFPLLSTYFAWKNKLSAGKIILIAVAFLVGLIFINLLPDVNTSDTMVLSCIHLVLFLWSILGFSFVGTINNRDERRLGFLKYNGDLLVMTALIVISGGILSAITINLFRLIGLNIEQYYFDYVGIFGLAAAPIVGTYLVQTNPQLVGKISPLIARIFSPLVLVMLIVYLAATIFSGKDPYNDREFLLLFNALLIGVLALIFFSVAESSRSEKRKWEIQILLFLSIATIIVNGIALSAILFRINEWGFTPNRTAILGSNILILINLVFVTIHITKVLSNKSEISIVGKAITGFLPVYSLWAIVVTFLFPFIFGFK